MPVVEEKRGVLTKLFRKPTLNVVHEVNGHELGDVNGHNLEAELKGLGKNPTPPSSEGPDKATGKSHKEILREAEADLDRALAGIRLPGKPDLEADVRARAAARLRARSLSS